MLSIYMLKSAFQGALRPLVRRLALRVSANQVTLLAVVLSLGYGVALYAWPHCTALWWGLPVFLFFRMALNAMDGMLAKEFGQQSLMGGFLNEMGDVIADSSLILGLAGIAPGALLSLSLIALLSMLTEFVGVCGWALCQVRRYDGPLGKSDRAFLLGLLGLGVAMGGSATTTLHYSAPPLMLLLCWTACNRLTGALRIANRGK